MGISMIFWLLVILSTVSFAFGLSKRSWKAFVISGITMILPAIYFVGAENWARMIALLPIIPFFFAYLVSKGRVAE